MLDNTPLPIALYDWAGRRASSIRTWTALALLYASTACSFAIVTWGTDFLADSLLGSWSNHVFVSVSAVALYSAHTHAACTITRIDVVSAETLRIRSANMLGVESKRSTREVPIEDVRVVGSKPEDLVSPANPRKAAMLRIGRDFLVSNVYSDGWLRPVLARHIVSAGTSSALIEVGGRSMLPGEHK